MRLRVDVDGPELFLGVVALCVSAGYLYQASQIAESLLEDAVGARGVPVALGWVMAALALVQIGRGSLSRLRAESDKPMPTVAGDPGDARPRWLALSLLAILVVYVGLLPYAGYIASTALLIGAVARLAGGAFDRTLLVVAIVGGGLLWLVFDPLLGIALPAGSWWVGR